MDREEERPDRSVELKVREVKEITIIDIDGRIDLNASELIELIGWLLKRGKTKILLNFEEVELLDYSGLSVLAIAYKNVKNHDGVLKFVAVPLHIEKLLRITQLLDVFELHEQEKLAIESFYETAPQTSLSPLRRRFKRLEVVSVPVHFLPEYRKDEENFFEGKATNLGGEGLFLHAQKIYPLKTELALKLQLPNLQTPLLVQGMVIWIADKELQPHASPGMGIQFKQLDTKQQKILVDFIDRNLVQRSGNV
ncbi:MAG: anti-sigma factor antagonist [Candidatus Omnitrophica bacterium]|nr:anti-sigma factor antagonist [Candidatus Omnitrophota bacterium]